MTLKGTVRMHSETIGTIAVFQNRSYLELYVPEGRKSTEKTTIMFGTGHLELIRAFFL